MQALYKNLQESVKIILIYLDKYLECARIQGMDDIRKVVEAVVKGFDYDPGHSDLDNEQPIHVSMTLGDYRRAERVLYEIDPYFRGKR